MNPHQPLADWLPDIGRLPCLLVVDDQPVNIRVVHELFREDCDILMATTGEQALRLAISQQPDLILLDVSMPDMDGYTLCRQLKADPVTRDIPVMFLTASQNEADEVFGFSLGAVDFIRKPVNALIVRVRVGTQLALKLQRDALQELALLDGLTGVPNRRRFDEYLECAWRDCSRAGEPLSLIIGDVDFFKRYNDHYGHLAGDTCLKAVAQGMKRALLRPGDLLARYGGEEFVGVLPRTDGRGASEVALRMLSGVAAQRLPHEKSNVGGYVSISLGVATTHPILDTEPATLVDDADRQLYLAKMAGRNCAFQTDARIHPFAPSDDI